MASGEGLGAKPTRLWSMSTPSLPVADLLAAVVKEIGGTPRQGQMDMALAVEQALVDGSHLLAQAGTGTGKSLAYLVPAIGHAAAGGGSVVVATATLALQRQLMTKDLPRAAEALAPMLPRPVTFALLKGRSNYVCKHKLVGGYPADESSALFDLPGTHDTSEHPLPDAAGGPGKGSSRQGDAGASQLGLDVVRVREWAEETETGDRDDLVPGVSDRAWRQVSVTAFECLGTKCPLVQECFVEQARTACRQADVVVTNHALLAIDANGHHDLVPDHELLIVDEAHELTDRVTSAVSSSLSASAVESAARTIRRGAGLTTEQLDAAARSLTALLEVTPAGRFADGLPAGITVALEAIRDASRALVSTIRTSAGATSDSDGSRQQALAAAQETFSTAEAFLDANEYSVLWCVRPDSDAPWARRGPSLELAPLSVASFLRRNVMRGAPVVLTSATLALGGTFDSPARAVGLAQDERLPDEDVDAAVIVERVKKDRAVKELIDADDEGPMPWRGIDVGTPFDYKRQGILYIARTMPPPAREGTPDKQLDEIEALITAAGGRTLALFSSRRAANVAAEAMRERTDLPILLQGDDVLGTLVAEYAADPRACLFGTLSLWQGVDVPGTTSQLVIIDRIPFPRPDDPVRSARQDSVANSGGNGFMAISATHAALLLAQGAGRLIRQTDDRGVVAVLDPRLATARYGTFLLRSMPEFWQTSDRDVVLAALRRLDEAAKADSAD